MSVEFRVNQNNASQVLSELAKAKQRALDIIGLHAEGYAQALAPVGSPETTGIPGYIGGTLKNSIAHVVFEENAVAIGTDVEYAIYQEFGTSRMKNWRGPYLKPAVMKHLDEYKAIAKSALKGV